MRKAKPRRRTATPSKPVQSSIGAAPPDTNKTSVGGMERKPAATLAEAELTAKNYRLARELVSFPIVGLVFPYSNKSSWN